MEKNNLDTNQGFLESMDGLNGKNYFCDHFNCDSGNYYMLLLTCFKLLRAYELLVIKIGEIIYIQHLTNCKQPRHILWTSKCQDSQPESAFRTKNTPKNQVITVKNQLVFPYFNFPMLGIAAINSCN